MLTCLTRAEPGSHLTGALCPRIAPSPMMTRCAVANFGNGFDEPLHLGRSIHWSYVTMRLVTRGGYMGLQALAPENLLWITMIQEATKDVAN
jgi:hypothetical protein